MEIITATSFKTNFIHLPPPPRSLLVQQNKHDVEENSMCSILDSNRMCSCLSAQCSAAFYLEFLSICIRSFNLIVMCECIHDPEYKEKKLTPFALFRLFNIIISFKVILVVSHCMFNDNKLNTIFTIMERECVRMNKNTAKMIGGHTI